MDRHGPNYAVFEQPIPVEGSKTFLGVDLGLTATEISRTVHRPGEGSTFVHAHRRNEEVYIVARGQGWLYVDGEEIALREGSVVRVSCAGKRAIRAADDQGLVYYCIQAQTGSLAQATFKDGYKLPDRASWM
jgi:uncharacterized cupin superfamily protein